MPVFIEVHLRYSAVDARTPAVLVNVTHIETITSRITEYDDGKREEAHIGLASGAVLEVTDTPAQVLAQIINRYANAES